jgi:hypothetical protein
MSTPVHPVHTVTTELLRCCYHGQLPRKLVSNTALPKRESPQGPPLLARGTLCAESQSVQKICIFLEISF